MRHNHGTEQITIQGHEFSVPVRYAAGHQLTEGEASALNQTFHEALRNNNAKHVKARIIEVHGENPPEGATLPEDHVAELQERLDKYAEEFEFGVRTSGGTRTAADPVKREAIALIKTAIRSQLKARGQKADAETIAEAAEKVWADEAKSAKFRAAAEAIVEQQKALADEVLDEAA